MPTVEPADFVASAGQGLQCVVDGAVVLLGNRGWMHENGLSLSEAQEEQVLLAPGLGVGAQFLLAPGLGVGAQVLLAPGLGVGLG